MKMFIYPPREDSCLLSEVLKKEILKLKKSDKKNFKFLDMGAGTGIQGETLINKGINPKNTAFADINPDAIKHLKIQFPKSKIIHSDLFSKIKKSSKFNIIVFNPPYLPKDKSNFDKGKDTTGGKKGNEIIIKFLKQAKNHLNTDGKIYLLTSSLTPKINFKKIGYNSRLIAKKKLFFEELFVLVLTQ